MQNDITLKELKQKTKEQVFEYINEKLSFEEIILNSLRYSEDFKKNQHYRFDMTGLGNTEHHNKSILDKFTGLGLFEKFDMLLVRFYNRSGELKYVYNDKNEVHVDDISGMGTREIIYKILQKL